MLGNIGGVWPLSIPVSQSWLEIGASLLTIQENRIALYIEIGIEVGGLASILAERAWYDKSFHYCGIEINPNKMDARVLERLKENPGVEIRIGNVFTMLDWIKAKVQEANGPALVLADGGNKPKEVAEIAPLLRVGDLLLAHDFRAEITELDIPDCMTKLEPPYLDGTRLLLMRKHE